MPRQECLEWFHVVEKLWDAGKAICRGTRRQCQDLEVTGPGNKYRREVLERVVNHFTNNAARMRYKKLRSEALPIASGVIEDAVRNLVGVRLDGPGMRWGRDRAEAILHLRCVLLNGQWDAFEKFLANRSGFRLRAQPVPTLTHDAKPAPKKAA